MTLNIIHEKCEKKAAEDSSLPRNAYLVTYVEEEKMAYDIVMCGSKTEIFDEYWDKYKEGLLSIDWAQGNIKPSLWRPKQGKEDKKVKRKRK